MYSSGWIFFHIWHKWSLAWEDVSHNDLWPWLISSRLFSCDIADFMDYIHMWHKYHPWGDNVSCAISRSKVKVTRVVQIFAVRARVSLVDHKTTISSYGCNYLSMLGLKLMSVNGARSNGPCREHEQMTLTHNEGGFKRTLRRLECNVAEGSLQYISFFSPQPMALGDTGITLSIRASHLTSALWPGERQKLRLSDCGPFVCNSF